MKKILNVNYAGIHGCYSMVYCTMCSFASAFLLGRGYSNGEIGLILAAANVISVFLQPLLADVADRSKRVSLIGVLQIAAAVLAAVSLGVFILQKKCIALTVLYILMMAWYVTLQPLINSLCFKLAESGHHINFGIARSMGSLGYAILCAVLGNLAEKYGTEAIAVTNEVMIAMLLGSLLLIGCNFRKACRLRAESESIHRSDAGDAVPAAEILRGEESTAEKPVTLNDSKEDINLIQFAKRNKMFFLLTVGVLGVYYSYSTTGNYMLQIIAPIGGTSEDMGNVFFLAGMVEIPVMIFFETINRRFSCQTLLKVAAVSFVLRILAIWLAPSVKLVLAVQILQALSFALILPTMVEFINQMMDRGEAVKGQALYIAMTTVASVGASLLGGMMLDLFGVDIMMAIATAITVIGAGIILAVVNRIHKGV